MKITVAIDSFKGSLSSIEAGNAVKDGIKRAISSAEVYVRPMADGGEGTVEAIVYGMGGQMVSTVATNPLGKKINCNYGIIEEKDLEAEAETIQKTAVIEMASIAGITLIDKDDRNPMKTTTYGVGELIKDAVKRGCRKFIIGIGGSATNDGGIGMLQALGYKLLDEDGKEVGYGAEGLLKLSMIDDKQVFPELAECTFLVACDVKNPLCGKEGCSAIFGPQKGASKQMIEIMDKALFKFGMLTQEKYGEIKNSKKSLMDISGAGAAGGLGFAFIAFTNAVLKSGIDIVIEETKLRKYVKESDIVVTGEGRLDKQTVMGKAPFGVAKLAKKYSKTVIAFAGSVSMDAAVCNESGIDAFFPIIREITSLDSAMDKVNAEENLSKTAEQVFRLINLRK